MSEVLWLNKNTLEEKSLEVGSVIKGIDLVKVPDGATFATGDKDNFVFRKDGWYYEHGEWIKTELTFDKVGNYSQLKLFWVKGGIKNPHDKIEFTLDRLLGCEVEISGEVGYIDESLLELMNYFSDKYNLPATASLRNLTFFTEDGDELTFDEYVAMYYGDSSVQS